MKSNKHFLLAQQEPENLVLFVPKEMKLLGNSHLDYSSKAKSETTDKASPIVKLNFSKTHSRILNHTTQSELRTRSLVY